MSSLGALFTLAFCLLVFVSSRRVATVAIVCGVCYITQGQELYIGFHFTAIRLILLAALLRAVTRGEITQICPSPIDKALIAYALCLAIVSTLRVGTFDQLVYQFGGLYNAGLSYFVLRALLSDEEDILCVLGYVAWAVLPMAMLMMVEANTGRNVFAIFGGVSEFSMVRDAHVRAQGAFRSPITGGAFGATFGLLFAGLLFARSRRRSTVVGLVACIAILVCARSSGPLLGFLLGLVALALWRFRHHTRKMRLWIALSLLGLHLVMKAPIWFLLGRISDVVGGGGYHRAYLIDNFVKTFNSWWLAGTSDTSSWMATELSFGGADLTNQFVSDGVNAGLLCLVLAVNVLVCCFRGLGKAMTNNSASGSESQRLLWGHGAALVGSIGILFSVTYFDQMHVIWYFLLASIATLSVQRVQPAEQ